MLFGCDCGSQCNKKVKGTRANECGRIESGKDANWISKTSVDSFCCRQLNLFYWKLSENERIKLSFEAHCGFRTKFETLTAALTGKVKKVASATAVSDWIEAAEQFTAEKSTLSGVDCLTARRSTKNCHVRSVWLASEKVKTSLAVHWHFSFRFVQNRSASLGNNLSTVELQFTFC